LNGKTGYFILIFRKYPSITECSGLAQTSNKIIQKGLAFARKQSGTDTVPSAETRFGILPRRLFGRGGASVVTAQCRQNPNGGSQC